MKKFYIAAGLSLLCGISGLRAQVSLVNPVPQQVVRPAGGTELFAAPKEWKLSVGKTLLGSYAEAALSEAAPLASDKAAFTLTVGVKGDKNVKRHAKLVPARAEGYYLRVDQEGAVIAAADARGAFYGVQSLLAMMRAGQLERCEVTDFPDVPYRGVVEGFYGTPWTFEARMSQLDFYGRNKMNVYLYGPKDDPYHSVPNWRKPYPEKEAAQIQQLVERARKNGVIFYWAIHPGGDIKWNDADRDLLIDKFERMYALGVRAFAVFFDDIAGEGTRADKQAELLNYIDDRFVQPKKDVAPLVMCPTEYNKAWANDQGGYLRTLGAKLNKDIQVMWTGNSVVHCIDKASMTWINERIGRKAYIWWNYPVSDFVRNRMLVGPVYGNGLDIADDMSAFVSNPMEHAEASKVALYSVADYAWNMAAYDSLSSWRRSLRDLLPSAAEALQTFASYSSDLGPNGHGFRREESRELLPLAQALAERPSDAARLQELSSRCVELRRAADILMGEKENKALADELQPWLKQAKLLAEYGEAACKMADGSEATTFPSLYAQAQSLQEQMYVLDITENTNPYQPGVKVGTAVMKPLIDRIFASAVTAYNQKNGTSYDARTEYQPYTLESTVPQLAKQPVSGRGNEVAVSPSNEVVSWPAGASLTVKTERACTLTGMSFDLGTPNIAGSFTLEALVDGTWQEIGLLHYDKAETAVHTTDAINGMKATALRLTNSSGKDLKVYFKNFRFTKAN